MGRALAIMIVIAGLITSTAGAASAGPSVVVDKGTIALGRPSVASLTPHLARVTAGCGGGRCTLYLSKSETRAMGNWQVPAAPGAVDWRLKAAYYTLAYAHVWFAQQYANRGWCSGFRLSIYPWESQGYFGYAC